jgi:hypothetical protein
MNHLRIALGLALVAMGVPALSSAVELQAETLKAWNDYIRTADSRVQADTRPFLWADGAQGRSERLRHGEILVAPVAGHGTHKVPDGLIHDWIGAVFIPNATLDGLFAVVHDYERYKDIYKPVVADSKVLACSPADQKFSMVWQHHLLFVNAAVAGQYEAHDILLSGQRGYNIAATTRVQEIEDYGEPDERLLPPGQGNGFIWELHSIARYEERDGGVYLELEAIALTRDIPASLRWLVNPVVNRLSIGSMTTTLQQTRDAVNSLAERPERIASCGGERRQAVGGEN